MGFLQTIKRDITRHRQKAALLGVLMVLMVVMSVRAVFQLRPQNAEAMKTAVATSDASTPAAGGTAGNEGAEAAERIRLSKELWKRLQDKRGIGVDVAFKFEDRYFQPDPTRPVVVAAAPERVEALPAIPKVDDNENLRRNQRLKVLEQSQELKVQSTTIGAGKPWAIVNGQLVSVGDMVKGFEITAIRAREVELKKEGVTIAVKMPDDPRGQ
jgi:hypothetical protein